MKLIEFLQNSAFSGRNWPLKVTKSLAVLRHNITRSVNKDKPMIIFIHCMVGIATSIAIETCVDRGVEKRLDTFVLPFRLACSS